MDKKDLDIGDGWFIRNNSPPDTFKEWADFILGHYSSEPDIIFRHFVRYGIDHKISECGCGEKIPDHIVRIYESYCLIGKLQVD